LQVARPDLHVNPGAEIPLGGGGFQQLLQSPVPGQGFDLVDLVVLKAKLQALLLLLSLLNPNLDNVDIGALQTQVKALLQLPNTALKQLDPGALNASLNAVFVGNFGLSGVKAELDKIDLPVVNVVHADVVKHQPAQTIAPPPVNPPVDPTQVSVAQTQAPAPTVTAQYQGNVGLTAATSEPSPSSAEPVPTPPPRRLPPTPTNSQSELDPTTTGNKFEAGTMTSPPVDSKPPTTAAPSTTSGTSGSNGGSVSRPTAGADHGGHVSSSGDSTGGGPKRPKAKP
jgi:hypothetical protein